MNSDETITKINDYTFKINIKYDTKNKIRIGWFSDIHFDSSNCNRKLLKKHLEECKTTNTYIILGGDLLDLMQGRMDPRSNKSDLKTKYKANDYVNRIIDDIVEFFEPYKELILIILKGNHDIKYTEKNGIDIVDLIGEKMGIETGSYSNWIKINFEMKKYKGNYKTFVIYHSHSSGSLGMRSKGTLAIDILAGKYPDANIYITEHSHSSFIIPISVERLSPKNKVKYETKYFLQVPSYENSWSNDKNNWWNMTNKGPRPMGYYELVFEYDQQEKIKYNVNFIN